MPTIEERFFFIIDRAIKIGTADCEVCEKEGRCNRCDGHKTCSACGGTGQRPPRPGFAVDAKGNAIELISNRKEDQSCLMGCLNGRCRGCNGSGLCWGCDGAGIIVPDPYDGEIVATVLTSTVLAAVQARDDDSFDTMNRLLDVASAWLLKGTHRFLGNLSDDQKDDLLKRWVQTMSDHDPTEKSDDQNQALTVDELRELGVLEVEDEQTEADR